jgi:hypothetical protein
VHQVIVREGQTRDKALDAYGRNLIGADDILIVNRIISAARPDPAASD